MSKKTNRIRLACFDGEYEFQLKWSGARAIEEKVGAGIGAVYGQVMRGRYIDGGGTEFGVPAESAFSIGALLEIVRQGLIGGGKGFSDGKDVVVTAAKANALISAYLDPDHGNRAVDAWDIATAIMHAFMDGVDAPEDEAGSDASNEITPSQEGETAGAVEV